MAKKRKKKTSARRKGSARKTTTKRRKVVRRKKVAKRKATTKRKKVVRRKKTAKRKTTKRKKVVRKKGKRKPSGLTKMKYCCSAHLEAIVGKGAKTRPEIVKKLWAYIKSHKCQHATKRRMIVPDAKLAKVIGSRPVDMLKLAGHLNKHIKK